MGLLDLIIWRGRGRANLLRPLRLQGMLDFESALAKAEAQVGIIPKVCGLLPFTPSAAPII